MSFGISVKKLLCLGTAALLSGAHFQVLAQAANYPAKSVRIVVPFTPGGATDAITRLVGQKLGDEWKQVVIVENRPGATGAVGSSEVARASADGYTLLMGTASTHAVVPAVNPNLTYRNLEDFKPVSLVAAFPNVLVVHPSLPAKTVSELVALLKANPDKYNFSSTGNGGSVHLAAAMFQQMTGTRMAHIPYKGGSQALNDLLSGEVQITFDNLSTVLPLIQSGKLRALGVASAERSRFLPGVPAIAETVPGFEANSWVGFFAPANTPADVVEKISKDTRRVLEMPDIVQALAKLGATAEGSTPEAFEKFVRKETESWKKAAANAGVKLQ